MKTADLTGAQLDRYVALAEHGTLSMFPVAYPPYSTDWAYGGPIIEREGISMTMVVNNPPERHWVSRHPSAPDREYHGPTAKTAAMRAFVAGKFGEEVPDQAAP